MTLRKNRFKALTAHIVLFALILLLNTFTSDYSSELFDKFFNYAFKLWFAVIVGHAFYALSFWDIITVTIDKIISDSLRR